MTTKGEIVALLNDRQLWECLDRIEAAAIETARNANRNDDEQRRDAIIRANCIRDIRRDLERQLGEDTPALRRA